MRRPSRRTIRIVAIVVLLAGLGVFATSAIGFGETAGPAPETDTGVNSSVPYGYQIDLEPQINQSGVETREIPDGAEVTVVATQGFFVSDENAELTAITRRGRLVYHNATYRVYYDVDPVPGERYTVEYFASAQHRDEDCPEFDTDWCTTNVIERVNLSSGDVERLYTGRTPRIHATRHHDFDRINETHVAIADIHEDRIFVYDTASDRITWQWNASSIYDRSQGGPDTDWTHINDVEILDDGRFMVSVRNMDEVVFVDPGEGAQQSWTLGEDDNHTILYEQHNPDFIPAERGGPSVVVADSENARVLEYQRTDDGTWNRTWLWRDTRMQWPRDADRLPNDRTLVVDSHGDRVLEISPNGSVAWQVHVGMAYDVERLGTGDESAGGRSMAAIRGRATTTAEGPLGSLALWLKDALPATWVNSIIYVGPAWFRFHDVVTLGVLVLTGLAWTGFEYRWASWSVSGKARSAWAWATDR